MKKLALSGALAASLLAITGGAAIAQSSMPGQSLSINSSGKVQLAGTVTAVSTSSLSVASWGGTWTVNTTNASILPPGFSSLAEIKVGDTVKVSGSITSGMSLNAEKILDKSVHNVKKLTGTVSNFNATASTFTLSVANMGNFNVVSNANTRVFVNGNLSSFTSLANGQQVTVAGSLNTTTSTITAATIFAPPLVKGDHQASAKIRFWSNILGWFKNHNK